MDRVGAADVVLRIVLLLVLVEKRDRRAELEGFPETPGVADDTLRLEVLLILVDIRVRSTALAFLSAVDVLEVVEEL